MTAIPMINPVEGVTQILQAKLKLGAVAIQVYYEEQDEVVAMRIIEVDKDGEFGDYGRIDMKGVDFEKAIEIVGVLVLAVSEDYPKDYLNIDIDMEAKAMIDSGVLPERVQFMITKNNSL